MLRLDRPAGRLFDGEGRVFEPSARCWTAAAEGAAGQPVDLAAAVRWLQRESGQPCRVPVGVIGPRAASDAQLRIAETVGAGLAGLGLAVICGGREGVMEAVCRGVEHGGGLSIGLLPDDDWRPANRYVGVPLATGLGIARNALIARAALALVAVGGGLGTLSEIALGLQLGRPVFTLADAPMVEGVQVMPDWPEVELAICRQVLAL